MRIGLVKKKKKIFLWSHGLGKKIKKIFYKNKKNFICIVKLNF